jgi:hypothetical protein
MLRNDFVITRNPIKKLSAVVSLQMTKKMKLTVANSVFKDAPVVSVAAKPGGSEVDQASVPVGMECLLFCLMSLG